MGRGDSMIVTFLVPPLARGRDYEGRDYVISIVYGLEKIRKI